MKNIKENKNPNWKGGLFALKCEFCGNDFKVKYGRKNKARFCSIKCANNYQRIYPYKKKKSKQIIVKCKRCQHEFKVYQCHIEKKLFCSECCQFLWRSLNFSGAENPNWRGGKSREPYLYNWSSISKKIRERDENACQNPYCSNGTNKMVVHHINYNKKDCRPKNLITLCNVCNSKANFGRTEHEKFYSKLYNR